MLSLNKRMVKVLNGSKYLKDCDEVNRLMALSAERKLRRFLAIGQDDWLIFYIENQKFFFALNIILSKTLKQRRPRKLRERELFKVSRSLKVIKRNASLRTAEFQNSEKIAENHQLK